MLAFFNRLTKSCLGIFCTSFLDSIYTKFMHVASKSNIIFMSENCRKRKFDLNEALQVPVTLKLSYFQCVFKSFIYFDIYVYI